MELICILLDPMIFNIISFLYCYRKMYILTVDIYHKLIIYNSSNFKTSNDMNTCICIYPVLMYSLIVGGIQNLSHISYLQRAMGYYWLSKNNSTQFQTREYPPSPHTQTAWVALVFQQKIMGEF